LMVGVASMPGPVSPVRRKARHNVTLGVTPRR
jgi:hypothetical protein